MAKGNKAALAATVTPAAPQLYSVTAKGMGARVKHGTYNLLAAEGGNHGTLQAIIAIGATFTLAQMQAACAARNHKLFAAYAIRRGWVAPVVETVA